MKCGIRSVKTPIYDVTLYELLKSYAVIKTQKAFKSINIPKLPVLTTEEGIKQIKNKLDKINDWTNIDDLIPNFYSNKKMKKTGLSGIFAASLELTKEGAIKILQEKIFDKVMIKKN